jgi:hypothetical protein
VSKKFKKDSEQYSGLFKPSHVSKQPTSKGGQRRERENKHTKELVKKRLSKDKTLTEAQVYKSLKCNNCQKYGHISKDCTWTGESNNNNNNNSRKVMTIQAELPESEAQRRNKSGFFTCAMTKFSKPMTEEDIYNESIMIEKNYNYCNLDSHANIHVWCNDKALRDVRKVKSIKVKGFGGMYKHLDTVGDHPLLGEVFIDHDNEYNIISCDLIREDQGYFRRTSKDNKKEFLYNDDIKSVITFERDPMDGFYKCSIKDLNKEIIRVFPNLCMAIS